MRYDAIMPGGVPGRTVVGAGLLALDVVVPDAPDAPVHLQAGGTCGNVLTALAYLGWESYPIARLGADGPVRRVRSDLGRWGVHLDFVLENPADATPVIAQHIRRLPGGGTSHSFSWRCPVCGADLPRYKPLRLSDVEGFIARLPAADVFFADRTSAGIVRLMAYYRTHGAVIVFEPSGVGNPRLFREAVRAAHVIKYSRERIEDTVTTETDGPRLVVETMGAEGLRYRLTNSAGRAGPWRPLPAIPAREVRDTAGCGDWSTAGIIDKLPAGGIDGLLGIEEYRLHSAVRYGQALAAWNCQYEGARGGMYQSTRDEFDASIPALLRGEVTGSVEEQAEAAVTPATWFSCSACPGHL